MSMRDEDRSNASNAPMGDASPEATRAPRRSSFKAQMRQAREQSISLVALPSAFEQRVFHAAIDLLF